MGTPVGHQSPEQHGPTLAYPLRWKSLRSEVWAIGLQAIRENPNGLLQTKQDPAKGTSTLPAALLLLQTPSGMLICLYLPPQPAFPASVPQDGTIRATAGTVLPGYSGGRGCPRCTVSPRSTLVSDTHRGPAVSVHPLSPATQRVTPNHVHAAQPGPCPSPHGPRPLQSPGRHSHSGILLRPFLPVPGTCPPPHSPPPRPRLWPPPCSTRPVLVCLQGVSALSPDPHGPFRPLPFLPHARPLSLGVSLTPVRAPVLELR